MTFSLPDTTQLVSRLLEKLHGWLESLVVMLPNLLLAALVVVLGMVVARVGQRLVEKLLTRLSHNEAISRLLGSLVRIGLLALFVLWALGILHLDRTVTSVLAGMGVVGLALGFAFKDIAANFMSGFLMALSRPFGVGDLVELAGHKCRVQRIELRATEVETLDGLSILVPNQAIFTNPIINYTRTANRRMTLQVGTAYGDDMEKVRAVVLAVARGCPGRDLDREPELYFEEFGDSSINFQVRIWLADSSQRTYLTARSETMIGVKKAFDREGITIPFPIRTLDFGADAVGGARLDQMRLPALITENRPAPARD